MVLLVFLAALGATVMLAERRLNRTGRILLGLSVAIVTAIVLATSPVIGGLVGTVVHAQDVSTDGVLFVCDACQDWFCYIVSGCWI